MQNIIFFAYRSLIGIGLPWNADLAVLGMSFMSLGLWYQAKADPFISNKQLCLSIIITAVIFRVGVSWLAFITTESVDWYSNRFGNPVFFVVGACAGIFATILISRRFSLHKLAYLGANSIVWYGLHRIIIDATFILYNKLDITIIRGSLLSLILALISVTVATVLLIPVNAILTKYFPFLIGKKGRIKDDGEKAN